MIDGTNVIDKTPNEHSIINHLTMIDTLKNSADKEKAQFTRCCHLNDTHLVCLRAPWMDIFVEANQPKKRLREDYN